MVAVKASAPFTTGGSINNVVLAGGSGSARNATVSFARVCASRSPPLVQRKTLLGARLRKRLTKTPPRSIQASNGNGESSIYPRACNRNPGFGHHLPRRSGCLVENLINNVAITYRAIVDDFFTGTREQAATVALGNKRRASPLKLDEGN